MGDATRPTVVIDTMQNAFCDDETTLRLMLGTRELGCYCVVENLSAEAASLQAVADAIYDAGRGEARAELERLRAEALLRELSAAQERAEYAQPYWQECERLRAENASLRAQPRVHPRLWAYLTAQDEYVPESPTVHRARGAWEDAGCPLLATDDDATTPTVGASSKNLAK